MSDHEEYAALLAEAIRGSIMGVRIGDRIATVRERLGEPDPQGHSMPYFAHHPVEFAVGQDDDTIQMIYVEIPDDIAVTCTAIDRDAECTPTADPDVLTARVGSARICLDSQTLRVMSFAL